MSLTNRSLLDLRIRHGTGPEVDVRLGDFMEGVLWVDREVARVDEDRTDAPGGDHWVVQRRDLDDVPSSSGDSASHG